MLHRKPWERRLEDLAHTLQNCDQTYFDPELFRRNTNHFLQTARTVTFIIQKNKDDIPGFDTWYKDNVVDPWKHNEYMEWAKDARNTVEKEGDLESDSVLRLKLIFSYLEEEDVEIPCGHEQLLRSSTDKLIKFADDRLPSGIARAAAVRIARSWVVSELPSAELLHAMGYIYARIYDAVAALASHLDRKLPETIPQPAELLAFEESTVRVQFVKVRDKESYRIRHSTIKRSKWEAFPEWMRDEVRQIKETTERPRDFETAVEFYSRMASMTFNNWGYHIPMVFFLDREWRPQYQVTTMFADQADKFFFWRMLGEQAELQQPQCVVHISEAWVRQRQGHPDTAIEDMPITGEFLGLTAIDRDGREVERSWRIVRTGEEESAALDSPKDSDGSEGKTYFYIPVKRALGLPVEI